MESPLPERMPQGELKKHVGAVHVKGPLTLLQRKISNVLLLNAYEDLPDAEIFEHQIRLGTLAQAAGFDSNDVQTLREALEALVDVKIKWNILDTDGEEEWGVSTFLAQAVTKKGVCRYAYAPDLRRKLYNPEIYARINLSVQERFGSGYALALYENCVRFRRVGTTGWISLEHWRDLLGVEDGQYEQFKYLNRDVLKPAVKEVNRYSDIQVKMERRREKRRIVALKFTVHENPQLRLDVDGRGRGAVVEVLEGKRFPDPRELAPGPEHLLGPLQQRLVTFGLTEAQALDVSTEFDAARIKGNLDYVEGELERGRAVKNVPAFTLAAIREDFRPREVEVEKAVAARKEAKQTAAEKRKAEAKRKAAETQARRLEAEEESRRQEAERSARLEEEWDALSPEEQAVIRKRTLTRLRDELPFVYRMYEQEDGAGKEEAELSIVVRSTLKGYRYDALEERGAAVVEANSDG